jgi:ferredoxin
VTIAAKFSAVYFYQPQFCAQCEIKNGLPLFKDYLAGAKSLLELFNADNRLIVHSNEVLSGYLFKQEKNQLLNRRNFFNMIAVNVRKVPVALIEAALPDADPAFSLSQPNRRQKLVSAISQLAAQSSGVNPQLLPIISHQIEGPCYLCGACVKLCPAGALRLNEAKPPVFEVNPSWCMSCGLCRNICPQQAIAFSATVDTKDLLSQSFKALTVGETKNCLTCNAAFVGNDFAAVCLRCKFTAFR